MVFVADENGKSGLSEDRREEQLPARRHQGNTSVGKYRLLYGVLLCRSDLAQMMRRKCGLRDGGGSLRCRRCLVELIRRRGDDVLGQFPPLAPLEVSAVVIGARSRVTVGQLI